MFHVVMFFYESPPREELYGKQVSDVLSPFFLPAGNEFDFPGGGEGDNLARFSHQKKEVITNETK